MVTRGRIQKSFMNILGLKGRSISRELTVSLILLIVLFEGVMLAYLYSRQSEHLLKDLNRKADEYAVNLGDVLLVPIWDYDDEQISKIGMTFLQDDVFDEIKVIDLYGKILFQSSGKEPATHRIKRSIDLDYNGQVIGHADLFFSLDAYNASLIRLRDTILLVLTGSIVVILITTGVLLRVFMRKPLTILHQGIDRVAKGDYSYRFDEIYHQELYKIADRFSKMASEIEARENSLRDITKELQQEIHERSIAEKALRVSEDKYRLLFENANDAIFVAQDQVIKFPNPKTLEITGYTAQELYTMSFVELIHPEDREKIIDRHMRRLSGEEGLPTTYSFRIINREGDERLVELSAVKIAWEEKPATLNFVRDITDQKKIETQLQQVQRMESIGKLAGGIAHDFNNLLMGIQGRTSIMLMDTDTSHPYHDHLRGIEDYVKSAADLTKQLLGFARGGKYEVKPTVLNELIKKSCDMFGRTKKEITIHEKYAKDLWYVAVDRSQIEQVMLNLYVNAWQSMSGGGELYIETENVMLDVNDVEPYAIAPGKYVKISVTDTGVGMDKATQERIFDPFFTTKEMGRGTGLGLASAYGIIKNHNGFINVYSEKGRGATFNIYLPVSEKEVAEESKIEKNIFKGSETVLLVDDEDMVIEVGKSMLERIGYHVRVAKNGEDAIETYKKNEKDTDLVVLDMVMPDMGGGETYDRLKEINPGIKVLLSSGYSIDGEADEILQRGCDGFIQKPFSMFDLSQKIRGILDKD